MNPLYIFDIDGTITRVGERKDILKTENPARWDMFYDRCSEDTPNYPVIKVLESLYNSGADIIFMTGRRENTRDLTLAWFKKHVNIPLEALSSDKLLMRPIGNKTKDSDLKERWLNKLSSEDKLRIFGRLKIGRELLICSERMV